MRIASAFVLVLGLALGLAPASALAAPAPAAKAVKTIPTCGGKTMPIAVGNTWTYAPVAAPGPAQDAIARIAPIEPAQIIVTVKAIDAGAKGGDTKVTLEEKVSVDLGKDPKKLTHDERVLTTTITCSATKFDFSPDSIFFAGEPGGVFGYTIDSLTRKGTSWKLTNGVMSDAEWREEIAATWTRPGPTPATGTLELERVYTPSQNEDIATKAGTFKSEKLFLKTSGRVKLADAPADLKPMDLPAGWINTFWLSDNVGVVQTLNAYAHMYQLVDYKLN